MLSLAFLAAVPATGARLAGRILQISDLHFDQYYVEGSAASCKPEIINDGMCCRDDSVPVSPFYKARRFGDHHCDSPIALLSSFFQYLNGTFTEHPEMMPDFVVWTGDNDNHHKANITKESNFYAMKAMTNLFRTWLPTLQVFPAFGNLDTIPDGVLELPPNNAWLTYQLAEIWKPWLQSDEATKTIQQGGYYQHAAPSDQGNGLRIISLNTLLAYTGYKEANDPAGQWAWLGDQMRNAYEKGEKIWMVGHIPVHMYPQPRLYQYLALLEKYPNTVIGHFSGHTHRDFFVLLRGNNTADGIGPLLGSSFVSPSVVPDNVQPSFRLFDYDLRSKMITDVHTYGLANFEALNDGTAFSPIFTKRYSFLQAYGMSNLSLSEWERLVTRMKYDTGLFNAFYTNFHAGTSAGSCSGGCMWAWVCNLTFTTQIDRQYCIDSSPPPTHAPTKPPTTPPPTTPPPTKPPTNPPTTPPPTPSPPTPPPTHPPSSPPTHPPSHHPPSPGSYGRFWTN